MSTRVNPSKPLPVLTEAIATLIAEQYQKLDALDPRKNDAGKPFYTTGAMNWQDADVEIDGQHFRRAITVSVNVYPLTNRVKADAASQATDKAVRSIEKQLQAIETAPEFQENGVFNPELITNPAARMSYAAFKDFVSKAR